jgi:replicative DNA helicase
MARRGIKTVDAYNIIEVLNASEATRRYAEGLTVEGLQELVEMSVMLARNSVEEYKVLAHNVLDAAFRRDTFHTLSECQTMCFDRNDPDVGKKIYEAIDSIMLDFTNSSDIPEYKDVVDGIWAEIKARQTGQTTAIEFPFPTLNNYVVMEPGEVVAFCGGAKIGKSAMLLTCAVDLLRKNKGVLYIDSELSTKLWTIRLLAHLTKIPFGRLRSGNYGAEEAAVIEDAVKWIKSKRLIHLYCPVLDANTMYLAAKKAKHLINADVVILDYLKADSAKDDAFQVYSALGNCADVLKNRIAGDMGMCGLTAAQTTSTGKIADSARIARSMSTIVTITDKTIEEMQSDGSGGSKRVRVVLNRNGPQMTSEEWIDFEFMGSTCEYREAKTQHVQEEPY